MSKFDTIEGILIVVHPKLKPSAIFLSLVPITVGISSVSVFPWFVFVFVFVVFVFVVPWLLFVVVSSFSVSSAFCSWFPACSPSVSSFGSTCSLFPSVSSSLPVTGNRFSCSSIAASASPESFKNTTVPVIPTAKSTTINALITIVFVLNFFFILTLLNILYIYFSSFYYKSFLSAICTCN